MKLLVCGTRGLKCKASVAEKLSDKYNAWMSLCTSKEEEFVIVHGACPNSADEYAEEWAKVHGVKTEPYAANSGNYLKRNIEMVTACNQVFAFWDGFSYGTAHTIAHAAKQRKPTAIFTYTKGTDNGNYPHVEDKK